MLSSHAQTKQFKSENTDCTVTRDYIKNKISVRLNIGVDGIQLKSVGQINELIDLLREVRDDINDDVTRKN